MVDARCAFSSTRSLEGWQGGEYDGGHFTIQYSKYQSQHNTPALNARLPPEEGRGPLVELLQDAVKGSMSPQIAPVEGRAGIPEGPLHAPEGAAVFRDGEQS